MEIWKKCSELPDWYLVSNHGNIRSITRKVTQSNGVVVTINGKNPMKTHFTSGKYKRVTLIDENKKRKNFLIHRLVAFTFLKTIKGKNIVNHIDGNPLNNNVENLEWCNTLENEHYKQLVLNKREYVGVSKTKCGYAVYFKCKYIGHSKNLEKALEMYKKVKDESN